MIQVFILCHEGEIPYVICGLQDALQDDSAMQIVSQGNTTKMHMGYVLLEGSQEIPPACLAELQVNPDIYLYAVVDSTGLLVAQGATEDEQESEPARAARTPTHLEL